MYSRAYLLKKNWQMGVYLSDALLGLTQRIFGRYGNPKMYHLHLLSAFCISLKYL